MLQGIDAEYRGQCYIALHRLAVRRINGEHFRSLEQLVRTTWKLTQRYQSLTDDGFRRRVLNGKQRYERREICFTDEYGDVRHHDTTEQACDFHDW